MCREGSTRGEGCRRIERDFEKGVAVRITYGEIVPAQFEANGTVAPFGSPTPRAVGSLVGVAAVGFLLGRFSQKSLKPNGSLAVPSLGALVVTYAAFQLLDSIWRKE